jgi:hypothetical protein
LIHALRIGVCECIIEDHGQTTAVITRKNLGHRQANRSRSLLLRTAAQHIESERSAD